MRTQTVFILGLALASAAAGQTYKIKTVAGNGSAGFSGDGDIALTAQLNLPSGVVVDSAGNYYIADTGNKRIRKVTTGGIVSTLAGGGTFGRGDGAAAAKAQLSSPNCVAVDSAGNVYIADGGDARVRKVALDGTIATVAGGGNPPKGNGDGGLATSASLGQPYGIAFDRSGNLFIADATNKDIRKVTPEGIISTVAGGGKASRGDGGLAVNAQFSRPAAVAVDGAGNLYVADSGDNRIRKVTLDGMIDTVAGGGTSGRADGSRATSAELYQPQGVAVDSAGRLFITSPYMSYLSMVTPAGIILTIAGDLGGYGGYGGDAGPANAALLFAPIGLAVGPSGTLYVADSRNQRIRVLTPSAPSPTIYSIKTVAGISSGGYSGDGGPAVQAQFSSPQRVALDAAGNLYISDKSNSRVRKVTPDGTISTVAGNGTYGYAGDGGLAAKAQLGAPVGIAVDSVGNLYIADPNYGVVRKVAPNGIISTFAGSGSPSLPSAGDGGPASSANLYGPNDVALDAKGNLYICDGNYRIRKVNSNGIISTIAGNGTSGYSGDGGLALNAQITTPESIAVDSVGNVYFAAWRFGPIRKVTTDGIISTVAGNGTEGFFGDGGPAVNAGLDWPEGMAVDAAGNLFIADCDNHRIRQVLPDGTSLTIAGSDLHPGYGGDGGAALTARLYGPSGLAIDPSGRIYIADTGNNRVRVLIPPTGMPAIVSGGLVSASAFGAFTSVAPGSWIEIFGSNLASNSRSWTGADFTGSNAPTALDGTSLTIGGQAAFIDYISPTQVNAQVPSTVGSGLQPVILTTAVGSSLASTIMVSREQPGLLAPPAFAIGGKQYVAASFGDSSFVLPPGAIVGLATHRASIGDTISLWGIGFGAVSPDCPAGQIVQRTNTLAGSLHVYFGTTEATVSFAGLAPGTMGLYQLNVFVPPVASGDAVPISFTLNGSPASQKLYIAVQ